MSKRRSPIENPSVILCVEHRTPERSVKESGLARYISESRLDLEREGNSTQARPLFTATRDDLEWEAANHFLAGSAERPAKRDLIHLIVTMTAEGFAALGDEDHQRLWAIRLSTRAVMQSLTELLHVKVLRWVAGIHLNTDHPHVHVALCRVGLDPETGRLTRLEKLPPSLFPHRRTVELDASTPEWPAQGLLAEAFSAALAQAAGGAPRAAAPEKGALQ